MCSGKERKKQSETNKNLESKDIKKKEEKNDYKTEGIFNLHEILYHSSTFAAA